MGHLKGILKTVGIDENVNFAVGGLDDTEEFYKIHVTCEKDTINPKKLKRKLYKRQRICLKTPDIGCFVFECSDIPPFAREVVKRTGIPVFDFIGLAHMVARAIIPPKYPEFFA